MTMPLAILEVLDRDGVVRQAVRVPAWPVRVGRALDNDLVLDDPHVAPHHFEVDERDGRVEVRVGDTENGVSSQRRRHARGDAIPVGDVPLRLDIGDTHLRLRLATHAVAPELPLRTTTGGSRTATIVAFAAGLIVLGLFVFDAWLENDPEELTRTLTSQLMGLLLAGLVWCGAWALVSKVFTRRPHFFWHLRVMLLGVLATQVFTALDMFLSFAFSWRWLSDYAFVVTSAIGAAMLYFHLQGLEPKRRRPMVAVALGAFAVASGLTAWTHLQARDQIGSDLYMTHLLPPALRVARGVSPDALVQRVTTLEKSLDEKARKPPRGDERDDAAEE